MNSHRRIFKTNTYSKANLRHHLWCKSNKGPHMKIRPPAYGPHKEQKGPPHRDKGPHNVKKNPLGKKFPERGERLLLSHPPPPPRAPMYGIAAVL